MLLLLAEIQAHSTARNEVKSLLEGLVISSQEEVGTIFYAVHQQQAQPDIFLVYELYRDKAACDAHLESAALQTALQRMEGLLAQPPKIIFCDTVAHTSWPVKA